VTVRLPLDPSTVCARVCLNTPCCTNVTAKLVGSVLTSVQVTVFGPDEDHVSLLVGLVTVMANEDAARERRAMRKEEACIASSTR